MRISFEVYDYLEKFKKNNPNSVLADAEIIRDPEEAISRSGATVRVNLERGDIYADGTGGVKRSNIVILLELYAAPTKQQPDNRADALDTITALEEAVVLAFDNPVELAQKCISVDRVRYAEKWVKPASVKMPATVLELLINGE